MKATNQEISQQFSEGNFSMCYEYFADNIEWNIVGNKLSKGKENVISQCDKMTKEITTSTLKNTNVIGEKESIAIEGICYYSELDNKAAKLAYCDVYRFENYQIASITSYCVETKI